MTPGTANHELATVDEFLGGDQGKIPYKGTHRVRALEETVRLAWEVRTQCGVSRVADITGLDTLGIPVFNVLRPLAAEGTLTVSCGKGVDRISALASALMEAVERYSGEPHGRTGVVGTIYEIASRSRVLHPRALILDKLCNWTESTSIEWWPYRNLDSGDITWLPAETAFFPYRSQTARFLLSTNGLASGNSLAEATLHALYEVVERDVTTFGEILRRGFELAIESVPEQFNDLINRFLQNGLSLRLFSFEHDIDIPVLYVIIDDHESRDPLLINGGVGCHLSPQIALFRAITEAAQSRLSVISGAREDLGIYSGRREGRYEVLRSKVDDWATGWPMRRYSELTDRSTGSIETDIDSVLRRLSDAGLNRAYATELTMAGLPFAVVRAVVPGAEYFHSEQRGKVGPRLGAAMAQAGRSTVKSGG